MPISPTPSTVVQKDSPRYAPAPDLRNLPELDREILGFWEADQTFRASIDQRPAENQFVFYDGPPFANGLPHYGHLLTGFAKDIIPRFQTMKGKRVERRFGWDTHGLPAELAAEQDLGISGRKAILAFGVDRFNAAARAGVMKYAAQWREYVTRQARWVDFDNDYKTLDLTFMESTMWAFKKLWDKGTVYRDYRVVPYSWAVESPLSNFETRLDNSYRDRADPALTVGFDLCEGQGELSNAQLLIWTTTPWTVPCNLAVAVGREIAYILVQKGEARYLLSRSAEARYAQQLEGAHIIAEYAGSALAGLRYRPPFDYFSGHRNAFQVLVADFVTDGDGTGIVHISPGFGEDDFSACRAAEIEVVVPVDAAGRYTGEIRDYEGMLVFDANPLIIRHLKDEGRLFRNETHVHSYPHCWRTDQPLIYRAVDSWYIRVSDFRDKLVAHNEQITWAPSHVKHGIFGKWLSGAQDWNISRSRFWGTPMPVWISDDPNYPRTDVYGSLAELEADFGVKVIDLHRPFIDSLVRPNPDDPTGRAQMRRVEDVFDVWFDSGSMPFASVHYPFENKMWFEQHFPADFIVEYVAQTRGWFYTLMVLGVLLFDQPPFKNAVCHGVVLDQQRRKLSKRLKNYPDPMDVFDAYGSDVMRWFLMSSTVISGGDLLVPSDAKDIAAAQRDTIAPLVNAYGFFVTYANLEGRSPMLVAKAGDPLDQYILAKCGQLAAKVDCALSSFNIPLACRELTAFCEILTNWYIRRSRPRFWNSAGQAAKEAALDTLFSVLVQTCRIAAPLLPLVTEKLYKSLTGERSVHLTLWSSLPDFPQENDLVEAMDLAREACSAALSLRERSRLRVRLPLKVLTIIHPNCDALAPFVDLISSEVNVRAVQLYPDLQGLGEVELRVHPQIGRRVGSRMKVIVSEAAAGRFRLNEDGTATVAGEALSGAEFSVRLIATPDRPAQPFGMHGTCLLDTSIDEDQEQEGWARDLVRSIQAARKTAGFHVSDRVQLGLKDPVGIRSLLGRHEAMVARETLAQSIGEFEEDGFLSSAQFAERSLRFSLVKCELALIRSGNTG
ncbi:Isoleucyl-tRNA synthetase [Novosphingobium sp. CF614]|uniref:isoleucine--tRNA ligase n=1 Tax=Novosphingobium sp. CF614 TaxID=1884364 RepID=UPI0008EC8E6B|nr:isoleucine--tRNA ligase [Novosphingobium sp. CF614]SFG02141.1 Isoleucyl-tRNA synthetase [Novosphingobium sp. CF614]